jgi:cysteine and histidine-rich domain-containing protein
VTCRFDWHQTASNVSVSFYAKLADPAKTFVEVNKVTAKVNIVFGEGGSHFEKLFVLQGVS